jgi:predicted nucleotidyltransferase
MRTEVLDKLLRSYQVKIAYLFGSQKEAGKAFLGGEERKKIGRKSDLDIGVVFEKLPVKPFEVYGEIYADLSAIFEPFQIDLVFLQETDVLFQYEAIQGELLYNEEETFLDDYEEMVMKQAADLSFKKIGFEKDFLEALRDGYFEIEHR